MSISSPWWEEKPPEGFGLFVLSFASFDGKPFSREASALRWSL